MHFNEIKRVLVGGLSGKGCIAPTVKAKNVEMLGLPRGAMPSGGRGDLALLVIS